MSSAPDVTIRRALLSDEAAVMSLGDVYSGRDYLFALYSDLVQDPDTYPVVAVVNNVVVGFYLTEPFDGGVTVIKRAGRVAESYRGRGVFHLMEAELERHTAHERSQVMYEAVARTDKVDHLIDRFLSKGYRPVYRKGIMNKLLKPSNYGRQGNNTHLTLDLKEMSRQDLSLMFHAENDEPRLFPQKRLFNFYLGYRLMDENIPSILCKGGGAFYSATKNDVRTDGCEPYHKPNGNVQSQNGSSHIRTIDNRSSSADSNMKAKINDVKRIAMVTFYRFLPTRTGYLYFLDVYATPEAVTSRDYLQSHLQRHLFTARRHFPKTNGILCVAHDLHIPKDLISSSLAQLGICEDLEGQEDFQVLYEKNDIKR
ncbi:hypothetical protein EGW08_022891 [Elysia chlorotica]|uniref:N-acetyltransferase domain-containing protein n=1 Tax=Elysia chlorotica TaxID=188477 RepID=A0A433SJU4_ELYCH|nr:hypothetical protein EGW08_022891 [Elysia chlorotica]